MKLFSCTSGGKGKKFQITYNSKHPLEAIVDNEPIFLVQDKKFTVSLIKKKIKIGKLFLNHDNITKEINGFLEL